MNLTELRQEYTRNGLDQDQLHADPIRQFTLWMEQAQSAQLLEPNAMVLATVDPDGQPYTRTVLVKEIDSKGLVFYTNYESRKAIHIAQNAKVSALFLWLPLERQISINGFAEKISAAQSLKYFLSRPLGSRLGAWTSQQSKVIQSRALLEGKLEEMKRKYASGEIPLPSFWGGYRIIPQSIEFWQGRQNRLHDRFIYQRQQNNQWSIQRLQP